MAFRNIHYNNKLGAIHLWEWDEDGNRVETIKPFEPYLYMESESHNDAKSIYGKSLKKLSFKSAYERKKFLDETSIVRLFHNLSADQQFLLDNYQEDISTNNPLKIFFFDIETYCTTGKFSTPEEATDPINLITIYDTLSKTYYTWGLKKLYEPKIDNVVYECCKNEEDLLNRFLKFWKSDYPDVITGWNCHGYDIPYIINRIEKLFDLNKARELSPVNKIWLKPNASVNLKGMKMDRWLIHGISHLDYMDVYITFTLGDRESYSLNYIAEYELGEQKIAYNQTSLTELADKDWNLFVDYNIQDVTLLIKLEAKLKYIKLIQNLAYKGYVSFEKAMGKVSMITGAVAHQAMLDGMVIPTFNRDNIKQHFEGGFVQDLKPGLYENIVTYDANSLYPNTIISLNISPETKVGKLLSFDNRQYEIRLVNNKTITLDHEKFKALISKGNLAVSKSNVLYSQNFKGIIPKFIDNLYSKRVHEKNQGSEYKKLKAKETDPEKILEYEQKIVDCDTLSNVYKVVLNSTYGVFSQIYSPLFDIDHAESITLTGQDVVKSGSKIIYEKFIKDSGNTVLQYEDVAVYSDTDSCFIDFTKILEHSDIQLLDNGVISESAYKLIDEYGEHLNEHIQKWAFKELHSSDPRYFFKREKICDIAVLQKKKHYILHVLDDEGVLVDKFVYKGIEVAKSTMSKDVKDLIKFNIEKSILSRNQKESRRLFFDSYDKFCEMDEEKIAFRMKVNDYSKAESNYSEGVYGKGTPIHAKSAINYNRMLVDMRLDSKYVKITNGNKIKFFYITRNKYRYDTIAFFEKYPEEFRSAIKIDYKKMFEKIVAPVIGRVYSVIGWPKPIVGHEQVTDLFELLSGDS